MFAPCLCYIHQVQAARMLYHLHSSLIVRALRNIQTTDEQTEIGFRK